MCRASSKGRTRLLLEESMGSCRRTLGEPKQNTGHWERQVTAVGPSQTKLVRHNHKCRRIPETGCHLVNLAVQQFADLHQLRTPKRREKGGWPFALGCVGD
jgi:hypothetical protein